MKKLTNEQGLSLVEFAKTNGVGFEEWDENLEKLQNFILTFKKVDWVEKLKSEALKIGAQIHIIYKVEVEYDIPHNEAAMKGGPQTQSNYDVLKVGGLYSPLQGKSIKPIIMINFPKGGQNYTEVVDWGIKNGLTKSMPHDVFAVAEQNPSLNKILNMNNMYIVETTGCTFGGDPQACCVWFLDDELGSYLCWQSYFSDSFDWFTFSKELVS